VGVGIVVSTDAHAVEELGFMEFGVYQARRAELEAKDVANTRTLASSASCSSGKVTIK
jgi:histidinol phosphatase-like PHP family hydrolase